MVDSINDPAGFGCPLSVWKPPELVIPHSFSSISKTAEVAPLPLCKWTQFASEKWPLLKTMPKKGRSKSMLTRMAVFSHCTWMLVILGKSGWLRGHEESLKSCKENNLQIGLRIWITGIFYRFVRLFWLCDLAWKSNLLPNKICSVDQIFFITFQFQGSEIRFCHHFEPF